MPNAVKSDHMLYHKECAPEDAVNQVAIDVDEDETCENCGKSFASGEEAIDETAAEQEAEDEREALGTAKSYDPNDAFRQR